jgi:hypothetical protein
VGYYASCSRIRYYYSVATRIFVLYQQKKVRILLRHGRGIGWILGNLSASLQCSTEKAAYRSPFLYFQMYRTVLAVPSSLHFITSGYPFGHSASPRLHDCHNSFPESPDALPLTLRLLRPHLFHCISLQVFIFSPTTASLAYAEMHRPSPAL